MHEKVLFLLVCCCCFIYSACSTTGKGLSDYGSRASEVEGHLFELGSSQSGTAEAHTEVGRHLEAIEESVGALDSQIERSEASTRELDQSLKQGAEIIGEAAGIIEGIQARGDGNDAKKRGGK